MLELGGKSANVILDDADLEAIVPARRRRSSCFNAGQSCILPSRLLVPRSRLGDCVELAAEGLRDVPYGDPTDPDVFMGPLISGRAARARVEGYVEARRRPTARGSSPAAARPTTAGPASTSSRRSSPTSTRGAALAQEEVFGPVLSRDRLRRRRRRRRDRERHGLRPRRLRLGRRHRARGRRRPAPARRHGRPSTAGRSSAPSFPSAGRGQSGIGREWGVAGFEEFLELQSVGVGGSAA